LYDVLDSASSRSTSPAARFVAAAAGRSRAPLFGGKNRVTFSLPTGEPAGAVSVVGDFNAWEPGRHELVARHGGRRSVSVVLPAGEHRFRYLATDGVWLDDHSADQVDTSGSWVRLHPRTPQTQPAQVHE
jgi:hypothetical protein